MLKLQEIQENLKRIDGSTFQDLCDAYIFFTEPLCDNIHRTGSKVGKQRSVKGTPDSYYVLPNGKYVLLEYTVQSPKPKKSFLDKIKSDIEKCATTDKTGLQLFEIEKIIYCINCDLIPADHKELMRYAEDKGVRLDIKSLSTFSIGLLSRASQLAKEFLGIAIDSGQILDIAGFIKAYERSGYSTSLSNHFIGREDELKKIKESVQNFVVTILTGAPGVGKTRLALTLLEQIKRDKLDWEIYCIDNKHAPIYDDLKSLLPSTKNHILFIDDANRQLSNLKPILGLLREERVGKLHILITARDYALDEIEQLTFTNSPLRIRLNKLSDEQLTTILASPDFEVHNGRYVKRILEIADGSPRLAIMAAKLAIEKQTLDSLVDVTDLYDKYFEKTVPSIVFENQLYLKTMGIVSFFHSINKENGEHLAKILSSFGMDQYEFEESIIELEKLELVESSTDLLNYKIAEQVLGTYFFYYTFFKNSVLNFNVILQYYFLSHQYRVRDTIIPANNTFGYSKVYDKIDPYLNDYWMQISGHEETAFKFLDIFWLYKQEETLSFVYNKIKSLPATSSSKSFVCNLDKTYENHRKEDNYLHLLQNFFYHPLDLLRDAFSLAALYVTKVSEQYGYLVKLFKDRLIFNQEDEDRGFYRQHEFINVLADERSEISLVVRTRLFYDVIPTLMKSCFQVVTSARKRNAMALYRYRLPLTGEIKELRASIWKLLSQFFPDNSTESLLFFQEYMQGAFDQVKEIHAYDQPFISDIINHHFTPTSFAHCYLVQKIIDRLKKIINKGAGCEKFKSAFINEAYQIYMVLSYSYRSGKLKTSWEESQILKEKEIRRYFSISSELEFNQFYTLYIEINQAVSLLGDNCNFQYSLDIILHEAFLKNKSNLIFCHIIAKGNNPTRFVAFRIFKELARDLVKYREFKSVINKIDFWGKDLWLNNWYQFLPESDIRMLDCAEYLSLLQNSINISYVEACHLDKFQNIDVNFFSKLVQVIFLKNSQEGRIRIYGLFEERFPMVCNNMEFAKKLYLQQNAQFDHFDYKHEVFYLLLGQDKTFLRDYISYWVERDSFRLKQQEWLSIMWNHPDAPTIIEQGMDYLCENRSFSIREDICNVFFRSIPTDKKDTALKFLNDYLFKNRENEIKVDAAFDCVRNSFPDSLETILLLFLEVQPSYIFFTKIGWTTGFMIGNGNTVFGDIRARQYANILNIIEKIKEKSYRFNEHKAYLKERITAEKKYAERERKRKFLEEDR